MALGRVLGIDELGSVCRQHLLVGPSAAKAHSVTRMLQAIRLKMLFDSDVKHLKSASSVYRTLERTEEYWGRTPEISDGRSAV